MSVHRLCKSCGKSIIVYNTVTNKCFDCQKKRSSTKPSKPIKQIGKEGERYSVWLNVVARPYLDDKYGRACAFCKLPPPVNDETGEVGYHHVDHIQKRGSHIQHKYSVHNIRYLCANCHIKETDKKGVDTLYTL